MTGCVFVRVGVSYSETDRKDRDTPGACPAEDDGSGNTSGAESLEQEPYKLRQASENA